MSLAGGILKVVEDAARQQQFARVKRLQLAVGRLAGVELRALRFALEVCTPGTVLEGAQIDIDEPDGQAWCMNCSTSVTIQAHGQACPHCGGHRLQATGGQDLRVVELWVDDAPPVTETGAA